MTTGHTTDRARIEADVLAAIDLIIASLREDLAAMDEVTDRDQLLALAGGLAVVAKLLGVMVCGSPEALITNLQEIAALYQLADVTEDPGGPAGTPGGGYAS